MQNGNHCCVIPTCGKKITWRFWLCAECEEKYGRRAKDPNRPEWVNYLIREAARERRSRERELDKEVSMEDMDFWTRPFLFEETEKWNPRAPSDEPEYEIDFEDYVDTRVTYAGVMPDSDWSLLYDYSLEV